MIADAAGGDPHPARALGWPNESVSRVERGFGARRRRHPGDRPDRNPHRPADHAGDRPDIASRTCPTSARWWSTSRSATRFPRPDSRDDTVRRAMALLDDASASSPSTPEPPGVPTTLTIRQIFATTPRTPGGERETPVSTRRVPRSTAGSPCRPTARPPALIGTRDTTTGTTFPARAGQLPGAGGADAELVDVELSRTGRLRSHTGRGLPPPEPYVPVTDPHVPFAIAAVELAEEKMVVMGQVVAGLPSMTSPSAWRWSWCSTPPTPSRTRRRRRRRRRARGGSGDRSAATNAAGAVSAGEPS